MSIESTTEYCVRFLKTQKIIHIIRVVSVILLCIVNCYFFVIPLGKSDVIKGIFALLVTIALMIVCFFANPKRKLLCVLSVALTIVCIALQLIDYSFGMVIAILFSLAAKSAKIMSMVQMEPGYPDFDMDYSEVMRKNRKPDFWEAYDIEDAERRRKGKKKPSTKKTNAPKPMTPPKPHAAEAAAPTAEPGTSVQMHPDFKKTIQEEEVSDVPQVDFEVNTDIPDPVWDIPDPVMDTSSILSSVPDIAGDIQNLPDIPDIPKI